MGRKGGSFHFAKRQKELKKQKKRQDKLDKKRVATGDEENPDGENPDAAAPDEPDAGSELQDEWNAEFERAAAADAAALKALEEAESAENKPDPAG